MILHKVKNICMFISMIVLLTACAKKQTTTPAYVYANDDLSGTKWRLYQYKDNSTTTPLAKSDTLIFTSNSNYTYNGMQLVYNLKNCESCNNSRLTIYGTPFGDLSGLPTLNFKTTGQIISIPFSQLTVNNPQTYNLWLQKI